LRFRRAGRANILVAIARPRLRDTAGRHEQLPHARFGLGYAFFWLLGRALNFPPATTGGLMLTGGLANTSFVGLPMIQSFYGAQYLGLGILIDQAGSYLVLSTLGILVASIYSSGHAVNSKTIIRRITLFVPFQAFILALLSNTQLGWPNF
jgi:malate permease and related proteins